MSGQTSITVFDGAATPVSHTLNPVDNKVLADGTRYSLWREALSTVPVSAQVRVEAKQTLLKSGVIKTSFRVTVPVMESIAGQNAAGYTAAPKVAYEDVAEMTTYAHPRSTGLSRQICQQILRNLANNVSTSVAAVSAGVVKEGITDLVMPT